MQDYGKGRAQIGDHRRWLSLNFISKRSSLLLSSKHAHQMALPTFQLHDIILYSNYMHVHVCMQCCRIDRHITVSQAELQLTEYKRGGGSSPVIPPLPTPLNLKACRLLSRKFDHLCNLANYCVLARITSLPVQVLVFVILLLWSDQRSQSLHYV